MYQCLLITVFRQKKEIPTFFPSGRTYGRFSLMNLVNSVRVNNLNRASQHGRRQQQQKVRQKQTPSNLFSIPSGRSTLATRKKFKNSPNKRILRHFFY